MTLTIGIDASRNRSGGARAHLVGILADADPAAHGVREAHLWAYASLLDAIPDRPWLVKHRRRALERTLLHQLWWQLFSLPREARAYGCDLMFNTDAGSICPFTPAVTLSQDMLSYEPGERQRFGWSLARLRLDVLRHVQSWTFRRSAGLIFLTKYAADVIQRTVRAPSESRVIHHGIAREFRVPAACRSTDSATVRIVYVSNASMYKHQWNVVRAVGRLKLAGYPLRLLLVGGGRGRAQRLVEAALAEVDPRRDFIQQLPFVAQGEIARILWDADLFVFASSCENMPITLLEGMARGLPIASSDRGPMPEVLGDAGVYFDPESVESIAAAVERLLADREFRDRLAHRARARSSMFTWERAADETWQFLAQMAAAARRADRHRSNGRGEAALVASAPQNGR